MLAALSPVLVPLTEAVALAVKVAPSAIVSVAPVAGAVTVILFMVVAVAAPIVGVTKVGLVSTTNFDPVPVWLAITVALPVLVITPVRSAFVVTVAAEPVVFWLSVGKVQFVSVPDVGVPRTGVISVGLVSITNLVPVPVCEAMLVAFPEEVIGPVRLAFVVTVLALPVVF